MTTTITALYDTIRLEEKLLIESAKKNEINLEMVDCKKLSVNLNEKKQFDHPVLQRCVSYYRNLHSTAAIEGQGVRVVNCLNTGIFAGNKLFTHMLLQNQVCQHLMQQWRFQKMQQWMLLIEMGSQRS